MEFTFKFSEFHSKLSQQVVHNPLDVLTAGKRTISLNLKNAKAIDLVKRLSRHSDVVIEVKFAISMILGPKIEFSYLLILCIAALPSRRDGATRARSRNSNE